MIVAPHGELTMLSPLRNQGNSKIPETRMIFGKESLIQIWKQAGACRITPSALTALDNVILCKAQEIAAKAVANAESEGCTVSAFHIKRSVSL